MEGKQFINSKHFSMALYPLPISLNATIHQALTSKGLVPEVLGITHKVQVPVFSRDPLPPKNLMAPSDVSKKCCMLKSLISSNVKKKLGYFSAASIKHTIFDFCIRLPRK